jgi:hypothetical protein
MPPTRGGRRSGTVSTFVDVKAEPYLKNETSEELALLSFRVEERSKAVWDSAVTGMDKHQFDLTLVCGPPRQQKVVQCHQSVLASSSEHLAALLQGRAVQIRDGSWVTHHATMVLPGVRVEDMVRLLCLLYNGFAQIKDSRQAKELKDLTKDLGLTVVKLNKKDKRISIVPGTAAVIDQSLAGRHFLGNEVISISLEEFVGQREDSDEDPDDPLPMSRLNGMRGSRRLGANVTSPSRRMKIELPTVPNFRAVVEEVHTCGICHGKTKEGKTDKEASNLSFKPTGLKRLLDHYAKHLYDEGLIQQQVPYGLQVQL